MRSKRLLAAMLVLLCLPILSFAESENEVTEVAKAAEVTVNVCNTPIKGQILIEKTDGTNYLAGAVFEIRAAEDIIGKDSTQWYKSGDLVATITTSGAGADESPLLPLGKYTVTEVAAPEGYLLDPTAHTVELAEIDQKTAVVTVTVSVVNQPIPDHYELIKTDASGAPLTGVKFALLNAEGTKLQEAVSGKDGMVRFTDLPPGTYFIKETETLDGYTLSGNAQKLVLDEHYTAPTKMATWINYTTIQTGVNLAVTGVMWGGIALMLLSGTLGVIRKYRDKKSGK